jgi:cyanophycinase-like exopeptidase
MKAGTGDFVEKDLNTSVTEEEEEHIRILPNNIQHVVDKKESVHNNINHILEKENFQKVWIEGEKEEKANNLVSKIN